ncbi:MAG: hypothetical protein HOO96_33715, partial [Polyangiaceae bacterium]|nr:hypothetical protein [Polyangiaceae bacterium]
PLRAGTSFALGSTKQDGQLRVCGKDEHCTAVDATITIDAVSPQQITGSVSYAMPAGGNTTLPFLAARCPGHPGRGG